MPGKTAEWIKSLVATATRRHVEAREMIQGLEEQKERLEGLVAGLDGLITGHGAIADRLREAITSGELAISQAARAGGIDPLTAAVVAQQPACEKAAAELEDAVKAHNPENEASDAS
jgi:hypothetical protein